MSDQTQQDPSPQWDPPPTSPQPPKPKRHLGRNVALTVAGLLVAFGVIGAIDNGDPPSASAVTTPVTAAPAIPVDIDPATGMARDTTPWVTDPPTTDAPVTTSKPKPAVPKLTTSQEQAVGTAQDYLDTSHFSRSGLIKQLEFEQYSKADATFAVNYLHVDWRKQAVGTAQDYLDTSHFSRGGLIEQLKFEGYTTAEAVYAVGQVGL